jgi:ComF family protein
MSNFTRALTLQAPKWQAASRTIVDRGHDALFGRDCALCAARARGIVCRACDRAFARPAACCERCAAPIPLRGLCGDCRRRAPAFDQTAAAFAYEFPFDRLMLRFKYAGDLALGRWIGEALAAQVAHAERPAFLVVPPSTRQRLRSRGFNPALEIAKTVSRRLGVDCPIGAVARRRDTHPQLSLSRRERRRNLEGAFECRARVAGCHVAIVDDVMTTGATADAIAAALKSAGAARVSVWVAARTPRERT